MTVVLGAFSPQINPALGSAAACLAGLVAASAQAAGPARQAAWPHRALEVGVHLLDDTQPQRAGPLNRALL